MSGFHELGDEFAGDEANEEWDAAWAAYSAGDQPDITADRLPLSTVLHLPVGQVEIRGDDPGVELCLITAPAGSSAGSAEFDDDPESNPTVLTVNLSTSDQGQLNYSVVDQAGSELDTGDLADSESATDLLDRILQTSFAADARSIYLDAACLELEGRGVLILGNQRDVRDSTCRSLLAVGARYLTDSVVSISPATGVVNGVGRRRFGVEEDLVVGFTTVDDVLLLDAFKQAEDATDVTQKGVLDAAIGLASFIQPGSRPNPMALPSLARLLNGARIRRCGADQAAALLKADADLLSAEPNAAEPASVDHQFAGQGRNELLVLTEIGSTDQPQTWLLSSDEAEIVVGGPEGPRKVDHQEGESLARGLLDQNRRKITPAAFGLPGCPVVGSLAAAWQGTRSSDLPASLPTGLVAELVDRGLVLAVETGSVSENGPSDRTATNPTQASGPVAAGASATIGDGAGGEVGGRSDAPGPDARVDPAGGDQTTQPELAARSASATGAEHTAAAAARAHGQELIHLLGRVLDASAGLSAEPVILGDLVDAVDGRLPGRFIDIARLELLVNVDVSDRFVSALESIGLVREPLTVSSRSLDSGFEEILTTSAGSLLEVEVYRTLASGPFGVLVDPREFHAMAVPVRVGDRWVRALHPVHRFIHACLRYERAEGADFAIARSVVANAPQVPQMTGLMLDQAERLGAASTVLTVVVELNDLLPGIPAHLVKIATGRSVKTKRPRRLGRRS